MPKNISNSVSGEEYSVNLRNLRRKIRVEKNTRPRGTEGLSHRGIAQISRRQHTDFASPWTGLFGSKSEEQSMSGSPLQSRFRALTRALTTHGKEVGTGHKRILIPKGVLNEEELGKLGFQSVLVAIPEAGQTRFSSFRHPNNPYHIHEHGKYWTMHKDDHVASTMALAKMRNEGKFIGKADVVLETIKGLPHLITEGLPGLYYYMKGRIEGTEGMASRLIRELSPAYKKKINRMSRSNTIPGTDDAYNTIEGLHHGGLAQQMRRTFTMFGSGFDRARDIARALGMTYDALLGSSMFKHALKNAKIEKRLGEGVAGVAHLMSTSVGGQELRFVKKELRPFEETVEMLAANSGVEPGSVSQMEFIRKHAPDFRDLGKESRALTALRDTQMVPTSYGTADDTLFMEAMPGAEINSLQNTLKSFSAETREKIGVIAMSDLNEVAEVAASKGLINKDIHGGNVLLDTETGRLSWIDWGAVEEVGKPASDFEKMFYRQQMSPGIEGMRQYIGGRKPVVDSIAPSFSEADFGGLTSGTSMQSATTVAGHKGKQLTDQKLIRGLASTVDPGLMKTSAAPVQNSVSFSGMNEAGIAATKRRSNTDFGSPYRGMAAGVSKQMAKSQSARVALQRSSIDLRAAQEKIWHCAIRGGRYHNRKNRGFVKQLSSYGGGV